MQRIDYESHYDQLLQLSEHEEEIQARILPRLPESIIDVHVHASDHQHYSETAMTESVYNHMMSTFPVTTLEHSARIDDVLMPGKDVRKARFAHAYSGIDHFGTTEYLINESPQKDYVFSFGLSDTPEQIERTIDDLRVDRVSGLKMYYLANGVAKSNLYDYFPIPILETAQELEKPIVLHLPHSLYNSTEEVLELAKTMPDLKIILAHMGLAHVVRPDLEKIMGQFAEHRNILADTSQVNDTGIISTALKTMGPEKVLFGTDEPLNLLRAVIYDNPDLGPRLLTDYPFHWVDPEEHSKYIHLNTEPFIHSHWMQLDAILSGVRDAIGNKPKRLEDDWLQMIFNDNTQALLDQNA